MRTKAVAMASGEVVPSIQRTELDGKPAWLLAMRNTAALMCLDSDDALLLPYWGSNGGTTRAADYVVHPQGNRPSYRAFLDGHPAAYPIYGEPLFKEVCLVVSRPDGARETRVCFVQDRVTTVDDGRSVLDLVFEDQLIGLRLIHRFEPYPEHDVVARSVTVENTG